MPVRMTITQYMVDNGYISNITPLRSVETLDLMPRTARENGSLVISDKRRHHEVYLSDPRKVVTEKMRTIIRHPITR